MTDLSSGDWRLVLRRQISQSPDPTDSRASFPIPPFAYPGQTDFTLTAPWVAIATSSRASVGRWWTGCYARIQVLLPNLEPEAIGLAIKIPVNRGARLIQIPSWALEGYQVSFEIPIWLEELTIEVYLYAPP